jgi:gamma-glutamyltranspeptidase/glutathione hydrolase
VSPRLAGAIAAQAGILPQLPRIGDLMLPNGRVPSVGDLLVFPNLADSLETIGREGRDVFYSGWIGNAITDHLKDLGGWFVPDDLANFTGEWTAPLSLDYRGTDILQFPPNSQGITALFELGMLLQEQVAEVWGDVSTVHAQIEAKKRSFAIRDATIADPRFVDIDTDVLLSDAFLIERWQDFDPDWATAGQLDRGGDTVYLCAVDENGLAVSLIQSMFQAFGSGVVDPETGIILHNRGTSFSLNPERVNVLEGGKRTLHTLMPAMMRRDSKVTGLFGTQGGDVQAQVHLQLVSDVVDCGFDPQQAIDAPRWIAGGANGPRSVLLERGFSQATIEGLAARGHELTIIDPWNPGAGHAQMILIDEDNGTLIGGADARADGGVSAY